MPLGRTYRYARIHQRPVPFRRLVTLWPNRTSEVCTINTEFVILGGDAPTLLDPVEEALDQVACPVQIWAKTDWAFAISLRRNVGPRTVFTGECSDPVRVVSSISKQHRA
jgi:hypothetical protein